jgi:hypothetical protein
MSRWSSEYTIRPSDVHSLIRNSERSVSLPTTTVSSRSIALGSPSSSESLRFGITTPRASTSVSVLASRIAWLSAARLLANAPTTPSATATTRPASASRPTARRVLVGASRRTARSGRIPSGPDAAMPSRPATIVIAPRPASDPAPPVYCPGGAPMSTGTSFRGPFLVGAKGC